MNIERKRLLKQRREKTLQNAKGKRPAEEYFLTALKASSKIHRALKNTQKRKKSDNRSINDENMNITTIADNINNLKIVADNEVNATTNAEDTSGNDNAENSEPGGNSTEDAPSPLIYGRKMNDPTKVKTSKRHRPIRVTPLESPIGSPHVDKDTTGKPKCHVFDPTNVRVYEFFVEGTPNPKD